MRAGIGAKSQPGPWRGVPRFWCGVYGGRNTQWRRYKVVLDKKLLKAADSAAKRYEMNRDRHGFGRLSIEGEGVPGVVRYTCSVQIGQPMQVKSCDNFYHNNTKKGSVVTYEIQCDAGQGSLDIEIVDGDGNKRDACSVPQGKTEDHSFAVPRGGKLHCSGGSGNCIWKGTTLAALRLERMQTLGSKALRLARKYQEHLSPRRLQRLLFAAYLVAIIWLNAYICRQAFFIEYTGKMNSMHGAWIAMARLAGEHWYKPTWWPY